MVRKNRKGKKEKVKYTKLFRSVDREKYAKATGTYAGYGPKSEGGSVINKDRSLSNAEIIHPGGNLLQLTLKEINDLMNERD